MKFEIFHEQPPKSGIFASTDFRWRLLAANGEPIASSGEGYRNKSDCVDAINLVKGTNEATLVVDLTSPLNNLGLMGLGMLSHGATVPLSHMGLSTTEVNRNRLAEALYPTRNALLDSIGGLPKK
jgi:uncharacterized protein YegP (UPF0339 family)